MILTALTIGVVALLGVKATEVAADAAERSTPKFQHMAKAKGLGLKEGYVVSRLRMTEDHWQRIQRAAKGEGSCYEVWRGLEQDTKNLPRALIIAYVHSADNHVLQRRATLLAAYAEELRRHSKEPTSPLRECGTDMFVSLAEQRLLQEFVESCVIEGDVS